MKAQLALREKVYGPADNSDILPPGAQFVRYPAYYLDQPVHKQPYGWMHPGIGAQLDSAVRGFYFGDPQTIYSWFEMIYQGLHPHKILDVGCGNGKLSLQLAKLFPNAEITGVDLSPHLVRWCRKKAQDMGVTNAQFYWQDAGDMIFEDSSFDIVHQGTLLHETPAYYIPLIVNEMKRVLKPGGRMSMFDWSIPETEADWAFRRRHTARGIEPFMMDYCEFNVVDYLKKIGMENVEVVARMTNQMVVVADKPQK
jgi:ubiquinone/menaquinone biosynthesis C-methylase UbiE